MTDWGQYFGDIVSGANQGPVANALMGLVILFVGMAVVKFIVGILRRTLSKTTFLNRVNSDGSKLDLASPILSLTKAVLTVFVLMAVLQRFGLTDVLAPLKDMVNQFTTAIPNIIGAGIIAYAGWIIAKTVSQIVAIALVRVDNIIAHRTGNNDMKVSPFGSAFIFGGILLPIIVAALGVLNIPAISVPASTMIQKLMAAVPNVIGAAIILLVAYYVSKFVVFMLKGLLDGMQFDALPAKIGMGNVFSETFTASMLVEKGIIFFSMLAASTAAVDVLGIDIISNIFARVLEFGGGILLGGSILIIGGVLSNIAYEKLSATGSGHIASVARFAILGLVLAMGLKSMGLADSIVTMAFGFTLGSVAVAAAIAFGLGGRDAAKTVADNLASRITK